MNPFAWPLSNLVLAGIGIGSAIREPMLSKMGDGVRDGTCMAGARSAGAGASCSMPLKYYTRGLERGVQCYWDSDFVP